MASSLEIWANVKNQEPIGEVFSIDGDYIDIFVYPEYLPHIQVGDIIAVETEWGYALCITLNTSYKAQRSFKALKLNMEAIKKNIPDIYRFHILLTRAVYTSRFEEGIVMHMKGGTPLLHALVFKLPNAAVLKFLKPNDKLDLSFMETYIRAGAKPTELRHFLLNYKALVQPFKIDFIKEFTRVILSIEGINHIKYIKMLEALR